MSIASPIAAPTRTFSINRAIFRAAISVGAAGIFVKLLATFKEIAVASVYGRSDAMDAFLAAALIPSLLVNLISESMNQALVPTLVRVREQEGHDTRPAASVEFHALDVPAPCRGQRRDGSFRARLLSAHCLTLCRPPSSPSPYTCSMCSSR